MRTSLGQKMHLQGQGKGFVKTVTGVTPEIVRVSFMRIFFRKVDFWTSDKSNSFSCSKKALKTSLFLNNPLWAFGNLRKIFCIALSEMSDWEDSSVIID